MSAIKFSNMAGGENQVDTILKDPNSSVDDILSQPDIIQQFSYQTNKFAGYFTKERIKQLVDYIIKEPAEDDQIKGHKYPYVAYQILVDGETFLCNPFCFTEGERLENEKYQRMNDSVDIPEDDKKKKKDKKKKDKKKIEEEEKKKKEEEERKKKEEEERQKAEALIDKSRIEMLDYILTFLETDKELNFVLAGYFSKVMQILIGKRPLFLITYLFNTRKDSIENIIKHSYRKSISELLGFILNYESQFSFSHRDFKDKTEKEFAKIEINKQREEIMVKLFQKIGNIESQTNEETVPNIIELLKEILDNKEILTLITSNEEILNILFNNLKIDLNTENITLAIKQNYSNILDLLVDITKKISANNNAKDIPNYGSNDEDGLVQQESQDKNIVHTPFSKKVFETLESVIKNFTNKKDNVEIDTAFLEKIKPLGSFRIKIVEYLTSLFGFLKKIPSLYDAELIKGEFFEHGFNFISSYPWNNLYQQEFFALLRKIFSESHLHTALTTHLFEKMKIIPKIVEGIMPSNKKAGVKEFEHEFKNKIKCGNIPFYVSLAYRINTEIGGEALGLFTRSREGSITFPGRVGNNDQVKGFTTLFSSNDDSKKSTEKKEEESEISRNTNLEKYKDDNWSKFFSKFIKPLVLTYETKLCEKKDDDFGLLTGNDDKNEDNTDVFAEFSMDPFGGSKTNDLLKESDSEGLKEFSGGVANEIELTDGFEFTDDCTNDNKEQILIEEPKKEEEEKEEEKKEEDKKEEEKKEEPKKEDAQKEEEKKEEPKKEEEIKEENKEDSKEEGKKE